MNNKLNLVVIANREEESREIVSVLDEDYYQVTSQIVGRDGSLSLEKSPDVALYIVCLPDDFHILHDNKEQRLLPPSLGPLLYITSDNSEKLRLWAYRQGAKDLLARPFQPNELRFRIDRIVSGDDIRFTERFTDKVMIDFVQGLLERNVQSIEPVLEPLANYGHFYPEVAKVFGRTSCDLDFLEKLANEGVLTRQVADRVRRCPLCLEVGLNYRETCPQCDSLDIFHSEVIHHFSCGHVGPLESFRKDAKLICPKCNDTLRHIGLDYEKPSQHYSCNACNYIFAESKVEVQCLWCGMVCEPAKTVAKTVFRYELTPLAQQAVAEQQISGLSLSALLKSKQTGLYSKQYIDHELEREFSRSQRTGNPFCFLLLRVEDFERIRTEHAARAADFVNSIFTAMSKNLRTLDSTCVWDTDILAAILPETPEEGGITVANRTNNNVNELEYLYSTHTPRISISVIAWEKDRFKSYQKMIEQALQDL